MDIFESNLIEINFPYLNHFEISLNNTTSFRITIKQFRDAIATQQDECDIAVIGKYSAMIGNVKFDGQFNNNEVYVINFSHNFYGMNFNINDLKKSLDFFEMFGLKEIWFQCIDETKPAVLSYSLGYNGYIKIAIQPLLIKETNDVPMMTHEGFSDYDSNDMEQHESKKK